MEGEAEGTGGRMGWGDRRRMGWGGLLGVAVHRGCWRGQVSDWVQPLGWGQEMPSHFPAWSPVSPTPCWEDEPTLQSWV